MALKPSSKGAHHSLGEGRLPRDGGKEKNGETEEFTKSYVNSINELDRAAEAPPLEPESALELWKTTNTNQPVKPSAPGGSYLQQFRWLAAAGNWPGLRKCTETLPGRSRKAYWRTSVVPGDKRMRYRAGGLGSL